MSIEQYLYVFGKTSNKRLNTERLLMNRDNKNWIDFITNSEYYDISSQILISEPNLQSFGKKNDFEIEKFNLLDKIKSDETSIEVGLKVKFSHKNSKPIYLQLETCSKYNV